MLICIYPHTPPALQDGTNIVRINGLALPLYRKMGKTMTNSRNLTLNIDGTGENGAQFSRPILPTPAGAEKLAEMVRRSAPALRIGRSPHQPHLHRTCAAPAPYQGRFMFGFRLEAKSEHEATLVRRWYGDGTAQNRRKKASRNWEGSAKIAKVSPPGTRTHQMQRGTGASLASVPLCTL